MTRPTPAKSFGFEDAREIITTPRGVTFTVRPPGGPDSFTPEQWADYDAGRLPSCVEEMSSGLREREVRRAFRNGGEG